MSLLLGPSADYPYPALSCLLQRLLQLGQRHRLLAADNAVGGLVLNILEFRTGLVNLLELTPTVEITSARTLYPRAAEPALAIPPCPGRNGRIALEGVVKNPSRGFNVS
jgi:hypothetical protein